MKWYSVGEFSSTILIKPMKKAAGLVAALGITMLTFGQDTLSHKDLDEVIIYSSKFAEQQKNIVQKIEVISAQRIAQLNAQNTGDLLINTGNVFVQKSQQGGSSPVIRGFEASRVLLVVDGIRRSEEHTSELQSRLHLVC